MDTGKLEAILCWKMADDDIQKRRGMEVEKKKQEKEDEMGERGESEREKKDKRMEERWENEVERREDEKREGKARNKKRDAIGAEEKK